MSKLNILYATSFNLGKGFGKDRATRQKLEALRTKVNSLKIISNSSDNVLFKFFNLLFGDLYGCFYLTFNNVDVFISRGYCNPLTFKIARLLGVATVREIHAYAEDEIPLLPHKGLKLKLVKFLARYFHKLDLKADIRLFNHPDLLDFYADKKFSNKNDFYVYNGASCEDVSFLTKSEARKKFGFGQAERILVFTGSASKWHGVDYLINLQKLIIDTGLDIKIVFGGGDISNFENSSFCINLTPLSALDCADLVRAADFCLLPVKCNRVSPGSPLKLYDYIVNQRYVIAQENIRGYADEVLRFNVGFTTNFEDPQAALRDIVRIFESRLVDSYPVCPVLWSDRIDSWIKGFDDFLSSKLN